MQCTSMGLKNSKAFLPMEKKIKQLQVTRFLKMQVSTGKFLKIEYKIIEKCFIWFSVYGKFILFDFFICNINYIAEQSF